jgi:hypothetical protein
VQRNRSRIGTTRRSGPDGDDGWRLNRSGPVSGRSVVSARAEQRAKGGQSTAASATGRRRKKTAGIVKQRLAGGFCDDVVCRQGAVGIGTSGDLVARGEREPQLCATLPGTCSPPRHWAWAWGLHPGWLRDCLRDWEPSQDISAQTGKAGAPTVPHPLHRIHFAWNSGPADCRLQSTSQKPLRVQLQSQRLSIWPPCSRSFVRLNDTGDCTCTEGFRLRSRASPIICKGCDYHLLSTNVPC